MPLISAEQRERVERYVASGIEQGARVAVGGKRPGGDLAAGFFYEPTLFVGVEQSMQIAREEIFGPVLPVITYDDAGEVYINTLPMLDPAAPWGGFKACGSTSAGERHEDPSGSPP